LVWLSSRLAPHQLCPCRGNAAIAKLDQSIEPYNHTLRTVEASKATTDPAAKSTLDRIYVTLEVAKEKLVQTILNIQQ
jgi:hypothetical protein